MMHRLLSVLNVSLPLDAKLFAEVPSQFFLKIRPCTLTFVKEGCSPVPSAACPPPMLNR